MINELKIVCKTNRSSRKEKSNWYRTYKDVKRILYTYKTVYAKSKLTARNLEFLPFDLEVHLILKDNNVVVIGYNGSSLNDQQVHNIDHLFGLVRDEQENNFWLVPPGCLPVDYIENNDSRAKRSIERKQKRREVYPNPPQEKSDWPLNFADILRATCSEAKQSVCF